MREKAIGQHLIVDFWGAKFLADQQVLESTIRMAVDQAGATLLHLQLHQFGAGKGITGVALLSESHLSVHTWPETHYAALDVFMCGSADPYIAVEHLRNHLKPAKSSVRLLQRGSHGAQAGMVGQ